MARFMRKGAKAPAKEPIPEGYADDVHPGMTLDIPLKELEKEVPASRLEVAAYTAKNYGARHENEDRVMNLRDQHGKLCFQTLGVLDGHDTEAASEFVSRTLPGVASKHLKAGYPVEQAYTMTMEEVEGALKEVCATAGTCVCSCTVAGRYVWCANLGDCRSTLIRLKVPESTASPTRALEIVWMSQDHKAGCPEEIRRIRAAGGHVMDGRVEGLEPSRTLGDFDVKTATPPGVISIVPDVRQHELGDGEEPAQAILVCATDGVWDVITGQDIADLIHARRELSSLQLAMFGGPIDRETLRPLRDLAEDLVRFAIAKGSHDDCTAVVALLSV